MKKIFLIPFILISLYGCERNYLKQGNNLLVPMPILPTDCSNDNKTCEIFTPSSEKINYNDNHHTLSGAKYLGEIINKLNWLNLN